jgi:23S rRNA (cytidine1920-2'-O)/16S rRNA (cytidine1409-2'-O)-methyltransferase
MRRRLDLELVRRGLATSRTDAQELIDLGRVTVGGGPALKAARMVDPGEPLEVTRPATRFVSRGGEKLDAALEAFALDVSGLRVLDAGASTGGFTDCVLQRGATSVVAVDVGHGQLHERIRADKRVMSHERCNVRTVDLGTLGAPFDLVVGDLSFISLRLVLAQLVGACQPGGDLVLLVKPQFEAGRAEVSKGRGIVTDPVVHERVKLEIAEALVVAGAPPFGWIDSPLLGADGNREFLVHARPVPPAAGAA